MSLPHRPARRSASPSSSAPQRQRHRALNRLVPVLQGSSSRLLDHIHDPMVELVIWRRRPPARIGRWLDSLPIGRLPHTRLLVSRENAARDIARVLDIAGMQECGARTAFLEDIVALTAHFATIMNTDLVDVRLEAIDHDACRKFHRDCVTARLLTTYRGPGTEWVEPDECAAALTHQKDFSGTIQQLPRYAVGLFKGNCAAPASGIVHRSPPIAGTGMVRLLLCLNLPLDASRGH